MSNESGTGNQVTFTKVERDIVTVNGPDAVSFLQGQVSQDVAGLATGEAAWSFVLQPQGKVDAWFRIQRRPGEELVLDVDPGWGDSLVTRLNRFKLRTKCDIQLSAGLPAVAVRGMTLAGGLPCHWPERPGSDHLGSHECPAGLPEDAIEMDLNAYEVQRIAAMVPAMGHELTDSTIPAEAGQWVIDASVSFTKGCFTGQELVARIDSRGGNVPRRLHHFTSDSSLQPGAKLEIDGSPVGTVTSQAVAADGSTVGLAYVKRSVNTPVLALSGDNRVSLA